jgi:XTP/dITP diphosphohydrolase
MGQPPVLLATRNPGKLRELGPLLAGLGLEGETLTQAGLPETAEEDELEAFPTFAENALAKARYFHVLSGGRLVLAEDSGLCVAALDGAPGVHSKRWGLQAAESATNGAHAGLLEQRNLQRLLEVLRGITDRRAWYACSAALVWSGGAVTASGESHGRILEAPHGTSGFGYDPIFWSTELNAGFGSVSAEVKAQVSHRTRAVTAAFAAFASEGGTISSPPVDPEGGAV